MSSLQILVYSPNIQNLAFEVCCWLFKLFLWGPIAAVNVYICILSNDGGGFGGGGVFLCLGFFLLLFYFLATEQTWDHAAGPELLLRAIPHVCFMARGRRRPVQKRFLLEMPFVFAKQFSLVQGDTNFQASWHMT